MNPLPFIAETNRTTIARTITEHALQAQVVQMARLFKWRTYHAWRSDHSESGFPDLVLLRGKRGIAAELKREDRNPTQAQDEWLRAFERAGFETYVWRPRHWLNGTIEEALR